MQLRALVVDDDPQIRELIASILFDDAEVVAVPDGPSALRALNEDRFGCVLLDVMMPGMSGNAVLEAIRSDPALRHLPVIMLTALAGDASHLVAFRGGADAYLTKPFDVDALLDTVSEVTELDASERAERRRKQLEQAELLVRIESSFGGLR
jgi:CheY-like chemotaxis protein